MIIPSDTLNNVPGKMILSDDPDAVPVTNVDDASVGSENYGMLNDDYLGWLKDHAKISPEYAEKLFDYYVNQANWSNAVAYDKWTRSHSYQMMVNDLKAAGLNPYLALNSLGGSSGSSVMASSSSANATQWYNTRKLTEKKILANFIASLFGSLAGLFKISN